MAKQIETGDRVRIHERRQYKLYGVYPWLRLHRWFTVESVAKVGRRVVVIVKNPAADEGAPLWKMDVRKPRPGAERKLAMADA